ncbi:MAG: DUF2288 family protein [Calothrix sp. C42_A2020_038]|nr:DUF2288 family protein [Calothrix sp. C42_A2020_038]
MSDIRAELIESLDEAEWDWLIPHAQRDAIILVSSQLDIIDVGAAIASEKTKEVQIWIDEALITKPSIQQLGTWNTDRSKRFETLIVQPYVLVKEK